MTPDEAVPVGDARTWWKSTYSSESANCVEAALAPHRLWVRNSRHPDGAVLSFPVHAWRDFIADVRDGEFDRPV
jgi:hypothetical protein